MNNRMFLSSVISLAFLVMGCNSRRSATREFQVGGLYSVANGDGTFGVVKILVLEPDVVHLRIYKQKFQARPASVDPRSLTLGGINDKDGFGIGHTPIPAAEFVAWEPALLSLQAVTQEELEGYEIWREESGKTF